MKTSTVLLSLLFLNSSVLFAQFMTWIFTFVNPLAFLGGEIILALGYISFNTLKDVRDCFDVKISM